MNTTVTIALAVGALVVLLAAVALRLADRIGLPSLLLYLAFGVALGESGLGIEFSDVGLTQTLGVAALVVILAEGGLTTRWSDVRRAVGPGIALATVGVVVSIAVVSSIAVWLLDFDWLFALLLGAVVTSTDAAAVFSTLRRIPLPRRMVAALELESGLNDAPVILLVLVLSEQLTGGAASVWYLVLAEVLGELAGGTAIGVGIGFGGAWLLRRAALPLVGFYPLATVALCVLAFASADLVHTSGFVAVYLCGLVLGNAALPHRAGTIGFAEGLASLAQIGLFVLLGLLVSPSRLPDALLPALLVGGALLLVARPLSVLLSVVWFRIPIAQQLFISWAGLRGAVPIVLATFPIAAQVPGATRVFDTVFVLVVVFTVVQGWSLPAVARLLRLATPVTPQDIDVESAPLDELGAELMQLRVPETSRLHGVYLPELRLPEDAAVVLVVRDGKPFVPDRSTRLMHGDQALLVSARGSRQEAERRLRAVSRAGRLATWRGESGQPSETD
ncbi:MULTISPECIES: potassium/proton antiporter [unclassified Modestobacter]|uniref:potassium/proton antiporter n=1 Tax=unclassified Modestobacter TaxID=2643866 RepID=UPI0022AA08EE|nr:MULTISPECIES: potassium/proton antiporter [unclassified Modestobacter]MCZ2824842.1 potassium/proton antiporter [Modestobacter sp. VKM Ac-2981]MCZ2854655.1 potassium/proton antiporter [Modestobacter sp. VKM Ac-2982]